jgi:hypothetical protein
MTVTPASRSVGPAAQRTNQPSIPDARLRYLAQRLHALGERPLYEFLREIIAGADPVARLERYAALDADVVRALGGDRLAGPRVIAGGCQ